MTKCDNTVVTIGDIQYLWGIFLLIASARKAGMPEPFLVGVKNFTPEAKRILAQLGQVDFVTLDNAERSLACHKPEVMLQAQTEYVTWADSDAFFTGNVSDRLKPASPEEIHFRLRSPVEMLSAPSATPDSGQIPKPLLDAWRRDIAAIAGAARETPRRLTTGSSCFCSLSLARHRHFLEIWHQLAMQVIPPRDVGVVDQSLQFYPQLDESTLNACLNFLPDAPEVQPIFQMDKDSAHLFVHFIAQPKPWQGWTSRAFRFFDQYVALVEWAKDQGYELPEPVPFCLKRSNRFMLRLLIPWMSLQPKLTKRLSRWMGRR